MTSRMRVAGLIVTAGALLALPLVASGPAQARHRHHHAPATTGGQQNSVAYPKAPGGMPAAANGGKPITPKSEPDAKPAPAAKATTEGARSTTGTPATAYPGAPTDQPSAARGKP